LESHRSQVVAVFVVLALGATLSIPHSVGGAPTVQGPFLDSIDLLMTGGETERANLLLSGDVDLAEPSFSSGLSSLQSDPDISVQPKLRNAYGMITINCERWPLNNTALRVAIALALDKADLCATLFGTGAIPVDAALPPVNPFSAEESFSRSYYTADLVAAGALLDSAGFVDSDSDGYRDAPNGTSFSIELLSMSWGITPTIMVHLESQLHLLNINATITDAGMEYMSRIVLSGDYDVGYLGVSFPSLDPTILCSLMYGENTGNGINYGHFSNSSYDALGLSFMTTTSLHDAKQYALALQEILFEQCPIIPVYCIYEYYACRTDEFEGFLMDPVHGLASWWSMINSHLKSQISQGGSLYVGIQGGISSFSPMLEPGTLVNSLIWDTLTRSDYDFNELPMLATSWSFRTNDTDLLLSPGQMVVSFEIRPLTWWSDGSRVTTDDVAASLNMIADSIFDYMCGLDDMVQATAMSLTTVEVLFSTTSYFHLWDAGHAPVMPKTTLDLLSPTAFQSWNPSPNVSGQLVTSGPYRVSSYGSGSYVLLVRNPDFYMKPNVSTETTTTSSITTTTSDGLVHTLDPMLLLIGAGAAVAVVVAIVAIFVMRKR